MPEEQTLSELIQLAEQVLREATSSRQDWRAIEGMAESLATLAARMAAGGEDDSEVSRR
jgi:hypothetical protein